MYLGRIPLGPVRTADRKTSDRKIVCRTATQSCRSTIDDVLDHFRSRKLSDRRIVIRVNFQYKLDVYFTFQLLSGYISLR